MDMGARESGPSVTNHFFYWRQLDDCRISSGFSVSQSTFHGGLILRNQLLTLRCNSVVLHGTTYL